MRNFIVALVTAAVFCGHPLDSSGQTTPVSKPNMETSNDRTEWVTLQLQTGIGPIQFYSLGLGLTLFTVKEEHFYYSIVEGGAGDFVGLEEARYFYLGSRVGYPLMLDSIGHHQLRFGLGLGFGATAQEKMENGQETKCTCVFGIFLSPNIRYVYQLNKNFSVGLDLQALLPTFCSPDYREGGYPWALFLSLPVALSF